MVLCKNESSFLPRHALAFSPKFQYHFFVGSRVIVEESHGCANDDGIIKWLSSVFDGRRV